MKEFFTRQTANEGIKLPLTHPDGSPSEHWLQVRGVDSDSFRKAETKGKQRVMELIALKDEDLREEEIAKEEINCIAALIVDWSFPEPLTHESAVMFLTEAPQVRERVNTFAAKRSEFFAKKSSPSTSGSKKSSSSKTDQEGQKSHSKST